MKFDFSSPYKSTRLPVFARNVVSTSHPLATQAGLRMMLKGGNAVDAAIAAAATLTITEPVNNGIGSDAFCILWDGHQLQGLNGSGPAPQTWTPEYFLHKYGADKFTPPKRGFDSVTVPGAVASWVALSDRYGKLPFADLMEPAIDIAERGFLVPFVVQQKWASAVSEFESLPGYAQSFLPHGRAPEVGELFQFQAAARGLRAIAESKGQALYGGEIAQAIERFSLKHNGTITAQDFADYRPEWVTPLAQNYRDHTLHEIPPNGQGIAALIALGILDHFDIARMPIDGVDSQHIQIEAIKLAFADVYSYVADPLSMNITPAEMLAPSYLASRAKLIKLNQAQNFGAGNPVKGGTIYLSTADENGMMVSFIQSNYVGFGSGVVEPEYGISLQNRGFGFGLQANGLNPFNIVAPGKRPFHTIIPAFLTKEGKPVMSFGVMGGNMQPQGHLQTLVRMLDYHQNPQAACDAPRWRFNQGLDVDVESNMNPETIQGLSDRGHKLNHIHNTFQDVGAGQFIWQMGDPKTIGYLAASDPRRDGQASGF